MLIKCRIIIIPNKCGLKLTLQIYSISHIVQKKKIARLPGRAMPTLVGMILFVIVLYFHLPFGLSNRVAYPLAF